MKRAMTDPHVLSGIGNAYSDEILHAARLSPFKQTGMLDDDEWLLPEDEEREAPSLEGDEEEPDGRELPKRELLLPPP